MFKDKTIFIAPLDWGLGHATRCVPVIKELLKNNNVILGVTPLTKLIFDEEFPLLEKIEVPSYNINYSESLPLWIKLGLSYPKISKTIALEQKQLESLIGAKKIDVVISDNRFGLYSSKAHCVFITHQLFLKAPVFEKIAQNINKKYILNFNDVWVADYEEENKSLSGDLSHGNHFHKNVKYIGPKSRLTDTEGKEEKNKYNILILLSGPEPQRSILEENLFKKLKSYSGKVAFVRGSNSNKTFLSGDNISVFDFPKKEELKTLILSSEKIICRSGYSTLMDMHLLGKKELLLIPTPGQSEQEYLAKYWQQKFGYDYLPQKNIFKLNL